MLLRQAFSSTFVGKFSDPEEGKFILFTPTAPHLYIFDFPADIRKWIDSSLSSICTC